MYKYLVFCTDFSEHSDLAFQTALSEARLHQASLTLLHVVTPGLPLLPGDDPELSRSMDDPEIIQSVEEYMKAKYLTQAGDLDCRVVLRRGHPSVEILAYLESHLADLVILGSQGLSGMGLIILGSVADRITRRSPCSCLIVRQRH